MALSYSTGVVKALFGGGDSSSGSGFGEIFQNFVIKIYSGTAPTASGGLAAADAALPSSGVVLLGTVNKAGLSSPTGDPTAFGLNFGAPVGRTIDKLASESWAFKGVAEGDAKWFRVVIPGAPDTLDSDGTQFRIQGTIGLSTSGDIQLSNTTIAVDNTYNLNRFKLTWPV